MKGYCSSGDLDGALELLKDIEADEVMFNSLLDGCAKQQARELLTNAGVVPSNFTLSIMIKLFGRTRHRSFRLGSGTYYRVQFPAEHASLHVVDASMFPRGRLHCTTRLLLTLHSHTDVLTRASLKKLQMSSIRCAFDIPSTMQSISRGTPQVWTFTQ